MTNTRKRKQQVINESHPPFSFGLVLLRCGWKQFLRHNFFFKTGRWKRLQQSERRIKCTRAPHPKIYRNPQEGKTMSTPPRLFFFFIHETKPQTWLKRTLAPASLQPCTPPGAGGRSLPLWEQEGGAGGGEPGRRRGSGPPEQRKAPRDGVGASHEQAARPRHKPLRRRKEQTHELGCDLIWDKPRENDRGHLRGQPPPRPFQNRPRPPGAEVPPPPPPQPEPEPRASLTCCTELFSGTANSSFSFGVFTVTFMILGSAEAAAAGAPAPSAAAALSWELGGPPLSLFSAMAAAAVTQARRRERASEVEPGDAKAGRPGQRRMRARRRSGNGRGAALAGKGARSRCGLRRRARSGARQPPCVQTLGRSDIRSRRRRRFLLPAPPPTSLRRRGAGHAG